MKIVAILFGYAIIFVFFFWLAKTIGRAVNRKKTGTAFRSHPVDRASVNKAPSFSDIQSVFKSVIPCKRCGAKLKVPCNRGIIEVTCPKCGNKFRHDSGAKDETAAKSPTPPKPPRSSKPVDELNNYRPGGALRREINQNPTSAREALLNLIATWAASCIRTQLFDRTSDLWKMVQKHGGSLQSASISFAACQVNFDFRFSNAPAPGHTFQYSYNEITNEEGKAPIVLNNMEIEWVRCAALSHLADTAPRAKMKNGRIWY